MVIPSNALPAKKNFQGLPNTLRLLCCITDLNVLTFRRSKGCWLFVCLFACLLVCLFVCCCCFSCGGLKNTQVQVNVYTVVLYRFMVRTNGDLNSNLGGWPNYSPFKQKQTTKQRNTKSSFPYQWWMLSLPTWMVDFNGSCRQIYCTILGCYGLGKTSWCVEFCWCSFGCLKDLRLFAWIVVDSGLNMLNMIPIMSKWYVHSTYLHCFKGGEPSCANNTHSTLGLKFGSVSGVKRNNQSDFGKRSPAL